MAKLPSFQFYPGDWMKDPELRLCSIFARGLLVDLLCIMFEAKHRGQLVLADGVTPWTDLQIVDAVTGGDRHEKLSALEELLCNGVLKRDEQGIVYSKRLLADELIRQERSKAGSKGGSKAQANRQANGVANDQAKSSPSSSSSSSTSVSNNRDFKKFIPPTAEQVRDYCQERGNSVDPELFVDHYASNGWMRGKNKLKDWKAAVRTWEKNQRDKPTQANGRPTTNQSIANLAAAAGMCQSPGSLVFDETTGDVQQGGSGLLGYNPRHVPD
jgi:hypothetical protein